MPKKISKKTSEIVLSNITAKPAKPHYRDLPERTTKLDEVNIPGNPPTR